MEVDIEGKKILLKLLEYSEELVAAQWGEIPPDCLFPGRADVSNISFL